MQKSPFSPSFLDRMPRLFFTCEALCIAINFLPLCSFCLIYFLLPFYEWSRIFYKEDFPSNYSFQKIPTLELVFETFTFSIKVSFCFIFLHHFAWWCPYLTLPGICSFILFLCILIGNPILSIVSLHFFFHHKHVNFSISNSIPLSSLKYLIVYIKDTNSFSFWENIVISPMNMTKVYIIFFIKYKL